MFCFQQNTPPTSPNHPSCRSRAASIAFGDFRSALYAPAFPSEEKKPISNIHQTLLSFLQKARIVRNAKRHFAFGEKTFALRVRVALMNIWILFL